jgi:glycogen synthase
VPPLRVLQVSWEYPPIMYGGLGRHVHALSEALARAGLDVVVLTQGPPSSPVDPPADPGRPVVRRAVMAATDPDVHEDTAAFVRALHEHLVGAGQDLLAAWRPDVVHGHDWVVAEAAADLAAAAGVPLVTTVHATELGLWSGWLASDFSRWRDRVERALVARADRVVVCSAPMRDEVVDGLGGDPDRVVVIPNGVDPSSWVTSDAERADSRAALGLTADDALVVLVGRLEWEKGGQDAIDALAVLAGQGRAIHLALVGQGGQRDALAEHASQAGLAERVHMVGRLDDGAVAALLGAADVAVVPSRYEPFGLVALEAMAAHTPVVVTRAGGLADLVTHRETGLVVAPAQPAALARAIAALLDDPEQARTMAARARSDAVERFGWDAVARRTAEVYSSAAGRR